MDKNEFANLANAITAYKTTSVDGGPALVLATPDIGRTLSAANSPDSVYKEKGNRWIAPYNSLVRQLARATGYDGDPSEFYATTANEVNARVVVPKFKKGTNDVVYIRAKRSYYSNGSRNGAGKNLRKENTHMKNRKATLTLITLLPGAPLTLQITNAGKDATAWTRFLDVDNAPLEYEKSNWTKDVASSNQAAVDAVDAMIQIEEDFVAGKLDKDAALEQFSDKYVEWVVAHLSTNPNFVERRIIGLNDDGDKYAGEVAEEAAEDAQ